MKYRALAILLSAAVELTALAPVGAYAAGHRNARLDVNADGVYRIDASQLAAAMNTSAAEVMKRIRSKTLELRHREGRVAYLPTADGLVFYGQSLDSIYTEFNAYSVRAGKKARQMKTLKRGRKAKPPAPVAIGAFTDNVHLTLWHTDGSTKGMVSEGWGAVVSASRLIGGQWFPWIKIGYADDGGSLLDRSISIGLGYEPEDTLLITAGLPTERGEWRERVADGRARVGVRRALVVAPSGYGDVGHRQPG